MTDVNIEKPRKNAKRMENPTASCPPVSCYAFADHPPPTRKGGQQNETYGQDTVGLGTEGREEGEANRNNENKNKEQENTIEEKTTAETKEGVEIQERAVRKRKACWEAKTIECHFNGAPKREVTLRLDEVARAFYEYSCQLAKVKSQIETTVAQAPETRRTGTDG